MLIRAVATWSTVPMCVCSWDAAVGSNTLPATATLMHAVGIQAQAM